MSPAATTPAAPGARHPRWIALVLVAAVAALYAQTARHGFVGFDDGSYLTRNPRVAGGLTAENVRWAFGDFHSANWHPLTWLSHQLDVELFGLNAGAHHLVNAGLHALNTLLCFAFLRRATGATWPSALAALLFAVHPQRVESVAWAAERKDVLSGTFFFLTLLAYERYARAPSRRRYGLVALGLVLGLLAKPMLVTLPALLLLLDFWPLQRTRSARALVLEKLPLCALALGSAAVTLIAQRSAGAVSSLDALTLDQRLATAVLATLAYLRQAFWPSGLAFFYPHPALVSPAEFAPLGARVLLGALALAALGAGAWRLRRRAPALLVGWAWMLLMFLPVIGLVQVGRQFYADRYAYLPLLGLVLAFAFGARQLLPAAAQRFSFALGLAACAAFALVTWRQIGTWKDDPALCARALAVTERNDVAHQILGDHYQRTGEFERAREQYLATLEIWPHHYQTRSNLGGVYAQLGQPELAAAEFAEALRLAPSYANARLGWGWLCERRGDLAGARGHYELAVREHPDSAEAWTRLGDARFGLAQCVEARAAYERALALDGAAAEALAGLGWALAELGEAKLALARFQAAQGLVPGHARALQGEAWIGATSSPQSGLRDAPRAQRLLAGYVRGEATPTWLELRTTAAVLAANGRPQDAARAAAESSALAPKAWWAALAAEGKVYAAGRALGG